MRTAQRDCRFAGEDSHRPSSCARDRYALHDRKLSSLDLRCDRARPWCCREDRQSGRALAAVYPREAEIDFRTALAGSDFSLQNVVHHLVTSGKLLEISVTEQERRLFQNVNNVSDVDATIAGG